jgi:hypothetical protein
MPFVTGEEGREVAVGALPEGRFAGIACSVDLHLSLKQNRNWGRLCCAGGTARLPPVTDLDPKRLLSSDVSDRISEVWFAPCCCWSLPVVASIRAVYPPSAYY